MGTHREIPLMFPGASHPGSARHYGVVVGTGLLHDLGGLVRRGVGPGPGQALLVLDGALVAGRRELVGSLEAAGFRVGVEVVEPGEAGKSLEGVARLARGACDLGLERGDPVVAVGGGVVGDLAGFVAATYRRGVPWFLVPTTLLAMVDASVGGKTGVNLVEPGASLQLIKNTLGCFHQPSGVLIDVAILNGLPEREFRSGLGECVKHALIAAPVGDPGLLEWTRQAMGRVLKREAGVLAELIARNVAVKARIVQDDEFEEAPPEASGRMLLNLGHTFGHVIEGLAGVEVPTGPGVTHGEAVGLGLLCACRAASELGHAARSSEDRVRAMLEGAGLPTRAKGLPPSREFVALMGGDKKRRGGVMRVVLPATPGVAVVVERPSEAALVAGIEAIRAPTDGGSGDSSLARP